MATRRTQIVEALVTHLANNTNVLEANITRNYHVLDEVNDFPAITMIPQIEARDHRGGGRKIATLTLQIRGYAFAGDGSEIIGVTENLAEEIEEALDTFSNNHRQFEVEECRVTTLRTDEGLFSPYGIADLEAQIAYEVNV